MFDKNFGKCGPIFKILSPGDSQENSLCTHQRFPPHLQYVATLPWGKSNIQKCHPSFTLNMTINMFN